MLAETGSGGRSCLVADAGRVAAGRLVPGVPVRPEIAIFERGQGRVRAERAPGPSALRDL